MGQNVDLKCQAAGKSDIYDNKGMPLRLQQQWNEKDNS